MEITLRLNADELDAELLAHLRALARGRQVEITLRTLGEGPQETTAPLSTPGTEARTSYSRADFEEMRRELFDL